jgi:hypothetical protein
MQTMEATSWTNFKGLVSSKALLIQYSDAGNFYEIFASEAGVFLWHITLPKDSGTDVTDFETNFKPTANQPIEVKAGSGRPLRVVNSPQPIGTREHWKGYQIIIPEGQQSGYVDVSFSAPTYVKGGLIYSADVDDDDSVTVDVLLVANDAPYLPAMIDSIYLIPNIMVSFMSDESMLFPTTLKLRVTLNCESVAGVGGVQANVLVDFFKIEA